MLARSHEPAMRVPPIVGHAWLPVPAGSNRERNYRERALDSPGDAFPGEWLYVAGRVADRKSAFPGRRWQPPGQWLRAMPGIRGQAVNPLGAGGIYNLLDCTMDADLSHSGFIEGSRHIEPAVFESNAAYVSSLSHCHVYDASLISIGGRIHDLRRSDASWAGDPLGRSAGPADRCGSTQSSRANHHASLHHGVALRAPQRDCCGSAAGFDDRCSNAKFESRAGIRRSRRQRVVQATSRERKTQRQRQLCRTAIARQAKNADRRRIQSAGQISKTAKLQQSYDATVEATAADFVARENAFVDQQDAKPSPRQFARGDRAGGTGANDDGVPSIAIERFRCNPLGERVHGVIHR